MKNTSYFLTKFLFILALSISFFSVSAQQTSDTLKEKLDEVKDRVSGIDERLLTAESDLAKLNKIKLSGYIQAQYQHFESPSASPKNYFSLRRTRLKATYAASEGVKFVLQADFSPGDFNLKDAYVVMNDRWTNQFSLWAGQFNRPNYEVEYSSSQREVPERSRVIRAVYPNERALGAKLEFKPSSIPLKVQLALLNGNDGSSYKDATGTSVPTYNKDYDNFKDLMARATYSFKLGSLGGLDIGAHGYYGAVKANSTTTINGDYTFEKTVAIGDKLNRSWAGLEFQFFADVLGGLSVKGEYLFGQNVIPGYMSGPVLTTSNIRVVKNDTVTNTMTNSTKTTISPNFLTKFNGYYVYLIKNIGKKNQFALRYDYYDPNTEIKGSDAGILKYTDPSNNTTTTTDQSTYTSGSQVLINKTITKTTTQFESKSGKSDLAYGTLTLAWQYYFDDNIRITLGYEIPMNEKSQQGKVVDTYTVNGVSNTLDYSKIFPQNTLTLRIQAKF